MPSPRVGVPIQIYLPAALKAALVKLAVRNRRKLTGEVIVALENHLAKSDVKYHPEDKEEVKGRKEK